MIVFRCSTFGIFFSIGKMVIIVCAGATTGRRVISSFEETIIRICVEVTGVALIGTVTLIRGCHTQSTTNIISLPRGCSQ